MAEAFHLIVVIPEREPICYALSGETVMLGRSPDNDIQILVREVSTSHAQFHQIEGGYEISDLGSTNGTLVNDFSVKNGKIALQDGDYLVLGDVIPAYFVKTAEGEAVDVKTTIETIEADRLSAAASADTSTSAVETPKLAKPPTKKKLVPPGAVKKIAAPGQLTSTAEGAGSPTIKLPQSVGAATTKLGSPAVKKIAAPGNPLAAKKTPSLAKKGLAVKKTAVKKIAAPGSGPAVKKIALPTKSGAVKAPAKKGGIKLNMPKKD